MDGAMGRGFCFGEGYLELMLDDIPQWFCI